MIRGQFHLGWETIHRIALETRKKNKSDFFNPQVQSELARRPKKQRACYARNRFVLAALERGFDLSNPTSNSLVKIGPFECTSIVDVVNKLMDDTQMESFR